MREAIMNGDIVDLLKRATEMDECCNLADELIGHSLERFNFWTARVLDIYDNMGGKAELDQDSPVFTIFL
jgi:hypothetical protein